MKTLYLCGAGNPEGVRLALNMNRARTRWDRIVVLDDDPAKQGQSILGVEIIGPFGFLEGADPSSDEAANLVARTTKGRQSAMNKIRSFGLPFATLIDPMVDLLGVSIEKNVTVYPHAILCANASLGEGTVVFMRGLVGHGAQVGPGCGVAPGSVINARVELSQGVYIGSNASILPDLTIGAWATIGANSSVIQDVPAEATVMGVPAQILMSQVGNVNDKNESIGRLRRAQEKIIKSHRSRSAHISDHR